MPDGSQIEITNAIDCDGHVLEPIDALADGLEAKYRDRAIRVETGNPGLEYFVWNNKRSRLCAGGFGGVLGAKGVPGILPHPDLTYASGSPLTCQHKRGQKYWVKTSAKSTSLISE
jgi:hypothetical protein